MSINIYLKVFFDTFFSYFSLGLHDESLYFIALQFKNNIFTFSLVSFLGFLIALTCNYFIGFFIKKVAKKQEHNSFIDFLQKFSPYIIFFSTLANGMASQFFSIIYGFLNEKFYKFIFFAFLGRIFFVSIKYCFL